MASDEIRQTVRDQTFVGAVIDPVGTAYVDCVFVGCTIGMIPFWMPSSFTGCVFVAMPPEVAKALRAVSQLRVASALAIATEAQKRGFF